jgi:hypothetical protein
MKQSLVTLLFLACSLPAQQIESLLDWDALAAKASEQVNVNLAGTMLETASRFLKDSDSDQGKVKKLLTELKGIRVRSLKFDKEGDYTMDDVNKLRKAFQGTEWSSIVDVQSKRKGGDNASVFIKSDGKQIQGIAVIAAEPRELTVVHIDGNIDPEMLGSLGGSFGIPKVNLDKDKGNPDKSPRDKKDEE